MRARCPASHPNTYFRAPLECATSAPPSAALPSIFRVSGATGFGAICSHVTADLRRSLWLQATAPVAQHGHFLQPLSQRQTGGAGRRMRMQGRQSQSQRHVRTGPNTVVLSQSRSQPLWCPRRYEFHNFQSDQAGALAETPRPDISASAFRLPISETVQRGVRHVPVLPPLVHTNPAVPGGRVSAKTTLIKGLQNPEKKTKG